MRTQVEIDEIKADSMHSMIALIEQGMNALEIAEEMGMGLTPHTIRQRSYKLGLTISPVRRKRVERTTEYRSKPCKCHPVCMDHSFRADLVCDCGKTWGQHQHNPTHCEKQMKVRHMQNKEFCTNGHDLEDPANIYVYPSGKRKYCRACRNTQERSGVKKRDKPRTHCTRGHTLTEDNIYIAPGDGKRQCRVCRKRRGDERQAAIKAERERRKG